MASRKNRTDRNGQQPTTERDGLGERDGVESPQDARPPAPEGGTLSGDASGIEPAAPRPPEDMPPLDAASVGPEPDPDAARPPESTAADNAEGTAAETAPADTAATGLAPDTPAPPPDPRDPDPAPLDAPIDTPRPDAAADPLGASEPPRDPAAPPAGEAAAAPETDTARPLGSGGWDGDRNGGRDATPHDAEPAEEPATRSVAGTLLAALLLLLAGAAIGIWAAPRLAPSLPAGMAAWVAPAGGQLEARLAATEAETRAEIAALRADLARIEAEQATEAPEIDIDTPIAELDQRIDALASDLAALDGAETRDRLSRVETAVEGQQDTLATLRDQLAGFEPDGEATAQLDAYEAELAGLRGEFREVAGQIGALSRRIDEVAAQAAQQVELARAQVAEIEAEATAGLTRAEIEADIAVIRSALASGAPYEEPVGRLAAQEGLAVPATLYEAAPQGVATMAELRRTFPDAANRMIRQTVQTRADDSLGGRLRGFMEAQVATRSLEPQQGLDPDAVQSRMEAALRQDDLEGALAEAEALPPEAESAMDDWLTAARTRLGAVQGLEQLQADTAAIN